MIFFLFLQYDGYTSCPIPTKEGWTILAEFDYNGEPLETFPINQGKERRTMWFMKKNIMTYIYWISLSGELLIMHTIIAILVFPIISGI